MIEPPRETIPVKRVCVSSICFFKQTGMDGEIVDSLFSLFDQCVAIDFPTQVFYLSVHLFQSPGR